MTMGPEGGTNSTQENNVPTGAVEGGVRNIPADTAETPANNPPVTTGNSTENTVTGVTKYYQDIKDSYEKAQQEEKDAANRKAELESQIIAAQKYQTGLNGQKSPFGFLGGKMGERNDEIRAGIAEKQKEETGLRRELTHTPERIGKSRDQQREITVGYTGEIASDQTRARAMQPQRLQTLIEANTPLPGHEAPDRFIDLTPEQRANRTVASFDLTKLPGMTKEQQERELKETNVDALTDGLRRNIETINSDLPNGQMRFELGDPMILKTFAEYAYTQASTDFYFPTEVLKEGSVSLKNRQRELERTDQTWQGQIRINALKEYGDKVAEVENRALFAMTMWQIANEINSVTNETQITPEEFLLNFEKAKSFISDNMERGNTRTNGRDFEAGAKMLDPFSAGISQEVSGYDVAIYDIAMHATEFAGHMRSTDLGMQDISKILAYLAASIEVNNKDALRQSSYIGSELALRVALRNVNSPDNRKKTTMENLVQRLRPSTPPSSWDTRTNFLKNITKGYSAMLSLSGVSQNTQQIFGKD